LEKSAELYERINFELKGRKKERGGNISEAGMLYFQKCN
jgi:hypothetical protein